MNKNNQENNDKIKQNLMFSQLFNYNTINRDNMMDSSKLLSVENSGKEISDRKTRKIAVFILAVIVSFNLLLGLLSLLL